MNDKQYSLDIIAAIAERTIKRLWVIIAMQTAMCIGLLVCIYYLTH